MARNRLAGSTKGDSESAKYYQENPKARRRKNAYNKEYHATPKRVKYRQQLNKVNREKGTYGNGDGLDEHHVTRKRTRQRKQEENRADKKRVF